jgi:hypothetical protein
MTLLSGPSSTRSVIGSGTGAFGFLSSFNLRITTKENAGSYTGVKAQITGRKKMHKCCVGCKKDFETCGSDSFTTDKKDDFDWCVEFESTENTDAQPKEDQDDGR